MVSFAVQKSLSWYSSISLFSCFSWQWDISRKKKTIKSDVKSLLPVFSSTSYMFSDLTFKSLIHCEFILAYNVRWWFSFIFMYIYLSNFSSTICYINYFYPLYVLSPMSNIKWPYRWGFISGLSFCSIDSYNCFYASAMAFWLW